MIAHFAASVRLLAQGLGLALDEVCEHRDIVIADRDYSFEAGEIPAGTIASVRMRFDGIVDGEARVCFSATAIPRFSSTSRSLPVSCPA